MGLNERLVQLARLARLGGRIPDDIMGFWIAVTISRLLCECKFIRDGELARLSEGCQHIGSQLNISTLTVSVS